MDYNRTPHDGKHRSHRFIASNQLMPVALQDKLEGWQGPPAPFVYLITRSDAVDVVFGTMEGYASLGIPYMAHIPPERRW